ncbi:MAG: hypothetical protein JWP12_2298 [Bacteroidetes bacterium]|nr:hypothetical protein [Bacteroidota bacterium]
MKRPALFFVFFFLVTFASSLRSQTDSIVKFSDLSFRDEEEKAAFRNYIAQSSIDNAFDLFLTPYDKGNRTDAAAAHKKINESIASLQQQINGKPDAKKVKLVYDQIHATFFKVYKLHNSLANIFEAGEYNCVSASALYSYAFLKLGIPHQIMQTPEHVYLVAYPEGTKIVIETTNPQVGYFEFNDKFVEKYLKYLEEGKLISKAESDSTTTTQLFNKYYFSSEKVSFNQLASLQYSNYALYKQDYKNYEDELPQIEKAYFLYPSERHQNILRATLINLVSKNEYENPEQVSNLAMLCHLNNSGDKNVEAVQLEEEFNRIIRNQLIKNSNYVQFDQSFAAIYNAISDTVLKNKIAFNYHYELARLGYLNSKPQDYELPQLEASYKLNPQDADLRSIILANFVKSQEHDTDSKEVLGELKAFIAKFDFADDNTDINIVKSNCYLDLAYQSFYLEDVAKGENYLKLFEDLCRNKKEVVPTAGFVERAYATVATIYYKRGNTAKAKQLLKKGLEYAPDSFGLAQRIKQL